MSMKGMFKRITNGDYSLVESIVDAVVHMLQWAGARQAGSLEEDALMAVGSLAEGIDS